MPKKISFSVAFCEPVTTLAQLVVCHSRVEGEVMDTNISRERHVLSFPRYCDDTRLKWSFFEVPKQSCLKGIWIPLYLCPTCLDWLCHTRAWKILEKGSEVCMNQGQMDHLVMWLLKFSGINVNMPNTKDRIWPHFQAPRRELKIRRALEYFWRTTRCLKFGETLSWVFDISSQSQPKLSENTEK